MTPLSLANHAPERTPLGYRLLDFEVDFDTDTAAAAQRKGLRPAESTRGVDHGRAMILEATVLAIQDIMRKDAGFNLEGAVHHEARKDHEERQRVEGKRR
jgi:hypothetical protein